MVQAIQDLKDRLPLVRGRYLFDVPLAPVTWFRVGGAAQVTYKPADLEDLCFFLKHKPSGVPIHVIGVGSNLLVRDGGVSGVVIRLGASFTNIHVHGTVLDVGAGLLDRHVAQFACDQGIAGLEFLCGIPGTIGGAVRMNAGAYGSDMAEILEYATVVDMRGAVHHLDVKDLGLGYRHCAVPKNWIFVGARLKGKRGNTADISSRITDLLAEREKTQPVKSRTGGSTFANPETQKAWELIDQAGCRGLCIGGAMMSELHCNFMMNTGTATAADLEALGEEVRRRVYDTTGVDLRWEIERIGEHAMAKMKVGERAA